MVAPIKLEVATCMPKSHLKNLRISITNQILPDTVLGGITIIGGSGRIATLGEIVTIGGRGRVVFVSGTVIIGGSVGSYTVDNFGLDITVFHLGFRRGMAPLIIMGTLSCAPGTGISNTHPPQLRVQTESVKYVDFASYYHYVHKPLSGIVS